MLDFFVKCCMGCDEEEYNEFAGLLRQNDVLHLQEWRLVPVPELSLSRSVVEEVTGPATLTFVPGPSDFMPMSEVLKQPVAKQILDYCLQIHNQRRFGPKGSAERGDSVAKVLRFFTDRNFHEENLFLPGWMEAAVGQTSPVGQRGNEPTNLKRVVADAARKALQIMQGRCACQLGQRGGCMDIGRSLHCSRRCGVHLNHTDPAFKTNRYDTPTMLFDLSHSTYDHARLLSVVPTLEARAYTCHWIGGDAASDVANHARLDRQIFTITEVETIKPVPGPPRTVAEVMSIRVYPPVHDFTGTLIDLHNIICEHGTWGLKRCGQGISRAQQLPPRFTYEQLKDIVVDGFGVHHHAVFWGFPDEPASFKAFYVGAYTTPRDLNDCHSWRSGFTRRLIYSLVGVCAGKTECGCPLRLDSLPSCRSRNINLDHTVPILKTKDPHRLFRQIILPTDTKKMEEIRSLQPLCACCHKRSL
jgi:hypothetical protein